MVTKTKPAAAAFSERLHKALEKNGYQKVGATALAELLAPVFEGGISVQTAHKWVTGQSIPRPERLDVIAKWLGVSSHRLSYGPDPQPTATGSSSKTVSSKALAQRIEALTIEQRRIVLVLIDEFERISQADSQSVGRVFE